jgi:TolB-like protein/tetratricopeptide (TPR) repeat protein
LLWADLKRRKVIQVAIAYAIVAWLLIQIVVAIEVPLNLPSWTDTLVIVLLAIGFPVALVVSWMFDLTPEGLQRTPEAGAPSAAANTSAVGSRRLEYVILVLFAVAIAWLLYRTEAPREEAPSVATIPAPPAGAPPGGFAERAPDFLDTPPATEQPPAKSVAVLVCANLSPNADDEYFAAGVHEEILNQLAKIRDLSVIARTSMLKYADTRQTTAEIARELNVATIVECSVRYSGQTVRVTAQFIEAATGIHQWSETYDRDRSDIFAIQTDIATRIAASVQAELSADERRRIETPPTTSPEAYALYLKALATFDGTSATVDAARGYLESAVALDPKFARAHGFKATIDVLTLGVLAGGPASEDRDVRAEIVRRARESAETALALDPTVTGFVHSVLGWVLMSEWKWAEAGAAFARGAELEPNNPGPITAYAVFLLGEGEYAEAVRLFERGVSLDPGQAVWYWGLAGGRLVGGDFAGSGEAVRQGLVLDPSFYPFHVFASRLAFGNNDAALAEREARTVERLLGSSPPPGAAADLAGLYAAIGLAADAQRLVAYVETESRRQPVSALTLALMYSGVRDLDNYYEWLDTAIRTRDTYGYMLHLSMRRQHVLNATAWLDPRFQKARRDLGLADPP